MFYMSSIDQQFVEYIVRSLVSSPESVIVERRIDEKGVLLELTVDPEDLGRVIGKRGATAQSLRTLLRALGTKNDARYNLKIVDNGTGAADSSSDDSTDAVITSGNDDTAVAATSASDSVAVDQDQDEEVVVLDRKQASDSVQPDDNENSRVSKARRELQELDDLDV
jgi:predicted RNA-binding protein YlqC (UPF0109 family)